MITDALQRLRDLKRYSVFDDDIRDEGGAPLEYNSRTEFVLASDLDAVLATVREVESSKELAPPDRLSMEDIDQILEGIACFIIGPEHDPLVEEAWRPYVEKLTGLRGDLEYRATHSPQPRVVAPPSVSGVDRWPVHTRVEDDGPTYERVTAEEVEQGLGAARVPHEPPAFDDWASRIVDGIETKAPSQIEWEIVEGFKKAHRLGQEARAAQPLDRSDIDQIVEGIEHFCIGNDDDLDPIWRPYIDKLETLKATLPDPPAAVPQAEKETK